MNAGQVFFGVVACAIGLAAVVNDQGGRVLQDSDQQQTARVEATPDAVLASQQDVYASGGGATIRKEADGHFWATAYVNSMPVRFMVDTGATQVVLTERDARSIGINPDDLPRRARVSTAAGETQAGVVTLGRISVEGAEARDVQAIVMDDRLDHSLLGMSFLNRFHNWKATRDEIVIRR